MKNQNDVQEKNGCHQEEEQQGTMTLCQKYPWQLAACGLFVLLLIVVAAFAFLVFGGLSGDDGYSSSDFTLLGKSVCRLKYFSF